VQVSEVGENEPSLGFDLTVSRSRRLGIGEEKLSHRQESRAIALRRQAKGLLSRRARYAGDASSLASDASRCERVERGGREIALELLAIRARRIGPRARQLPFGVALGAVP
jgi:hypothetical protein